MLTAPKFKAYHLWVSFFSVVFRSGSGFYVKLSLEVSEDMYGILTCNHVLGSESEAKNAYALFNYEGANAGEKVTLRPEVYFRTHTVSMSCSNLLR